MKIRTNRNAAFGTEITMSAGVAKFNEEGLATVTKELGEFMLVSFPDRYYEDGKENPAIEKVKAENAEKGEKGAVETASFETEAAVEDEIAKDFEANKDVVEEEVVEETTGEVEKEKEEVLEETKDIGEEAPEGTLEEDGETKMDDKEQELRAELELLDVESIQGVLLSAEVPEDEYKDITDKDELINFVVGKNIL